MQERFKCGNTGLLADDISKSRELQIQLIKYQITMLKYQQLAESVIDVKPIIPNSSLESVEETKELYQKYRITFDEALQIKPYIADLSTIRTLEKYRKQLYFDDRTSISKFNNTTDFNIQLQFKQIGSLFDKEIFEQSFNPNLHGLCHHCKRITLRMSLFECNNVMTQSIKKKAISKKRIPYKMHKNHTTCTYLFCSMCIRDYYDITIEVDKDSKWLCACCSVSVLE
jgi:hypothetical protein